MRRPKEPVKREIKLTHDLLPPVNLLTEGPKQDQINDEVHKKFLEIDISSKSAARSSPSKAKSPRITPDPSSPRSSSALGGRQVRQGRNLGDDLALALKAESIRIERISGSSTVASKYRIASASSSRCATSSRPRPSRVDVDADARSRQGHSRRRLRHRSGEDAPSASSPAPPARASRSASTP